MKPKVYNIKNMKGLLMDGSFVYVGRPSKWGNPYRVGVDGTREEVVAKFRKRLLQRKDLLEELPELRGKNLMCFCAPEPCHADVLLELANANIRRD